MFAHSICTSIRNQHLPLSPFRLSYSSPRHPRRLHCRLFHHNEPEWSRTIDSHFHTRVPDQTPSELVKMNRMRENKKITRLKIQEIMIVISLRDFLHVNLRRFSDDILLKHGPLRDCHGNAPISVEHYFN